MANLAIFLNIVTFSLTTPKMRDVLSALKNVGYLNDLDLTNFQLTKQLILDLSNSFVQCTINNSVDINDMVDHDKQQQRKDGHFLSNITGKLDKIESHLIFLEKILEGLIWKKETNESMNLFLEKMGQYNNIIRNVISDASCIKDFVICDNSSKGNYQFFIESLESLIQNLNKNYDVTFDFSNILRRLNNKKIEIVCIIFMI